MARRTIDEIVQTELVERAAEEFKRPAPASPPPESKRKAIPSLTQRPDYLSEEDSMPVQVPHHFQQQEKIVVSPHPGYITRRVPYYRLWHWHEEFEFNYCCRSTIVNHVNGVPVKQTEGSLLLMNPQAIHSPEDMDSHAATFNLIVHKDWIEQHFLPFFPSDHPIYTFFFNTVYQTGASSYLFFQPHEPIRILAEKIICEYFSKEQFYQQRLTAYMLELLVECAQCYDRQQSRKRQLESPDDKYSALISYLQEHYSDVTLQSLAEYFGYSTAYLSRMIKRQFHKNFSSLLQDIRLKHTADFLMQSDLTVEKISEIVGYNDASYLNKLFRQKYGMSAARYRENRQHA